jgi:hypothetical protein
MKIKVYSDEDVYGKLAEELRQRGIDAIGAVELGRLEIEDLDHLAFAVSQERAVLTFNRVHYEQLAVQYFLENREHWGIIISPQYRLGELLRRALALTTIFTAEEFRNQLYYLQNIE